VKPRTMTGEAGAREMGPAVVRANAGARIGCSISPPNVGHHRCYTRPRGGRATSPATAEDEDEGEGERKQKTRRKRRRQRKENASARADTDPLPGLSEGVQKELAAVGVSTQSRTRDLRFWSQTLHPVDH
jgi:hypothetical protein